MVVETGAQLPANPLTVITLHGLGDSPENFARLVKRSTISARWIIPRATYRYGRGYSWFDIPPGALKAPTVTGVRNHSSGEEVGLACGRDSGEQEHGRRIVLMGFSQGGMLTYGYAATPGMQPLAGAIPIGGLLPKSLWPKRKTAFSIVALHGVDDSVVPFGYAKRTAAAFRARASDIEFSVRECGAYGDARNVAVSPGTLVAFRFWCSGALKPVYWSVLRNALPSVGRLLF